MKLSQENFDEVERLVKLDAMTEPHKHKLHEVMWETVTIFFPKAVEKLKGTDKDCWASRENLPRFLEHILEPEVYKQLSPHYKK